MKKDLKEWQKEHRITSVQLAKDLGVTVQTIHNFRGNKSRPVQKTIKKLDDLVARYEKNPFPSGLFFI